MAPRSSFIYLINALLAHLEKLVGNMIAILRRERPNLDLTDTRFKILLYANLITIVFEQLLRRWIVTFQRTDEVD
nr:hypothetical protein BV87_19130 [Sphingobium yanoikuyae]